MSKEEIREYLDRVERLEFKLLDEDKETLQGLIFGYNQCAKLLQETEQKIDKAIEYIENDKYEYTPMGITNKPINEELLEILKGSNND